MFVSVQLISLPGLVGSTGPAQIQVCSRPDVEDWTRFTSCTLFVEVFARCFSSCSEELHVFVAPGVKGVSWRSTARTGSVRVELVKMVSVECTSCNHLQVPRPPVLQVSHLS